MNYEKEDDMKEPEKPVEEIAAKIIPDSLVELGSEEKVRVGWEGLRREIIDALTAEREARNKAENELAGLLSNDTGEWKSAVFQKIKALESSLSYFQADCKVKAEEIVRLEAELAKAIEDRDAMRRLAGNMDNLHTKGMKDCEALQAELAKEKARVDKNTTLMLEAAEQNLKLKKDAFEWDRQVKVLTEKVRQLEEALTPLPCGEKEKGASDGKED